MPAFPNLPLRTDRLVLRPPLLADAEAMFAIFSDPGVMRYWSSPAWTRLDQALAAIEHDAAALAKGQHLRLAIERAADGATIGQCTLFGIVETCRRAEIGYCLASSAWGQGFMNEALRELIRYGFAELGLNRIESDIDPRNEPSRRALERLAFVREGLLRQRWIVGTEVSDSALYGLLREDWR
jgi:RimJ/RimL family protein N-acetyltransferase